MKIVTIIAGVLFWPLRVFRCIAGLGRDMFCPGRDDPEARQATHRHGRLSRGWLSFGGDTIAGRWRYVNHRIRRAGKGTRFRR